MTALRDALAPIEATEPVPVPALDADDRLWRRYESSARATWNAALGQLHRLQAERRRAEAGPAPSRIPTEATAHPTSLYATSRGFSPEAKIAELRAQLLAIARASREAREAEEARAAAEPPNEANPEEPESPRSPAPSRRRRAPAIPTVVLLLALLTPNPGSSDGTAPATPGWRRPNEPTSLAPILPSRPPEGLLCLPSTAQRVREPSPAAA